MDLKLRHTGSWSKCLSVEDLIDGLVVHWKLNQVTIARVLVTTSDPGPSVSVYQTNGLVVHLKLNQVTHSAGIGLKVKPT